MSLPEQKEVASPSTKQTAVPTAGPVARSTSRTSRLGEALKHVRSIEAHPPHHAHFDVPERAETPDEGDIEHDGAAGSEKTRSAHGHGHGSSGAGRGSEDEPHGAGRPVIDIEHMPCDDDPREWSRKKKNLVLAMMTTAVVRAKAAHCNALVLDLTSSWDHSLRRVYTIP